MEMRILIEIFLLSAAPLSTVPMYADENGSAKSALFFVQSPSVPKTSAEVFDTLRRPRLRTPVLFDLE